MSTPKHGDAALVDDAMRDARAMVEAERDHLQQALFDHPITPDEMLDAQLELGPNAGKVSVLAHARAKRSGRPKGARNRRTDDLAAYLRQFGPDPAVTLMITQGTDPHVLIEQSRRTVTRMTKGGNLVEMEEAMTYGEAMALKVRCAEAVMPYIHGKKPTAVDLTIQHDGALVIGGVTHSQAEVRDIVDAEFLELGGPEPEFDDEEQAA